MKNKIRDYIIIIFIVFPISIAQEFVFRYRAIKYFLKSKLGIKYNSLGQVWEQKNQALDYNVQS